MSQHSNIDGNGWPTLWELLSSRIPTENDKYKEFLSSEGELLGSVKYETQILNKNISKIRCFPRKVSEIDAKLAVEGTTDLWTGDKPRLSYETCHDAGCPLISVKFATDDTENVTIDDSAFAFCTQISSIEIPAGMSMDGQTTFFMGNSVNTNKYEGINAQGSNIKPKTLTFLTAITQPELRDVVFGYQGVNQTLGYPHASCLTKISDNGKGKILNKTFSVSFSRNHLKKILMNSVRI
jgi:hypothetical protein